MNPRGRVKSRRFTLHGILVLLFLISNAVSPAVLSPVIAAPPTCGTNAAGTCSVTIDARDFVSGSPLTDFSYIINLDNSRFVIPPTATSPATPKDPFPKYLTTESNSPIVREGNQGRATVTLPNGRYLVSVRSLDHKMWGAHFTLPDDAANNGTLTVRVDLTTQSADNPLPLGKIHVFVFEDNAWTNGAPDTEEGGLGGFQIGLEEQTGSPVTVDYNNNPLCGGICQTSSAAATLGFAELNDLGPATYFIDVHPPDGPCNSDPASQWYQTTTIDGGLLLQAGVEEGSDGTGAPGEQLWEAPNIRTAYWFGFVCAPQNFATSGTGEIAGTARNWQGWPPFDVLTLGEPVADPFVALSDSTTDRTVFVGRGDAQGNFDIQNVPAGSYNMAIWDEQLSYIIRFKPVTVAAGQFVDVNEDDPVHAGERGVGVSRWFGWLDGYVYKDLNGNGIFDPGEPPIANTDMDQRWRDGSIKEDTFTGPDGYYQYPTAEGGALGKWIINEQGFGRFGVTGASVHDEYDPSLVTNVPSDLGGNLLANQLLTEGHRATVDWGKVDYPAGTPGQIVGITYFATTRNEFDARFQAHENYEPGIPDVTILLETLGPDGLPNTADDVVVNKYVTDHWQHPSTEPSPLTADCAVRDALGSPLTGQVNPDIGPNCIEVPITGQQTKDGAFDGGYAFADYCPGGYDQDADDGTCIGGGDPVPLVAGTYIAHSIMPTDSTDSRLCNQDGLRVSEPKGSVPGGGAGCLYHIVREEDVNVDLGNNFITPAIPPFNCTGDDHVIDQATVVDRSPLFGNPSAHAPLCDKRLIVLENLQNANADFFMMTNFRTDPNGSDSADTRTGDVAEPGRIIGLVSNDIYFETDPQSVWYGEPRPIAGIPVGIYQRVDTVPNVNQPYDANRWRLFTTVWTSPEGTYEALLPSTETLNCPIPQGPCPGMYLFTVNDPGTADHPNRGYNPNILTATSVFDVWPGLTDQLDTPLDPISGTACEDPAVPARPNLLQVSSPVVNGAGNTADRTITITGDFIGTAGPTDATGGHINLKDLRTGTSMTLTRANGGITAWTPGSATTADSITIVVPAINTSTFRPGQKQLSIVTADANGGQSSVNGITLHVTGSNGVSTSLVTYTPNVVNVAPPPPAVGGNLHALQNAIDSAPAGSLLVLSVGTYNENVAMWKPLKIQGRGPGGIIGAHELLARDPEDPRGKVPGSVIDGRYFAQNATAFDATVAAHAPYILPNFTSGSPSVVLRGADVTVLAKTTTAYDLGTGATGGIFTAARVDGVGLMTGRGDGAGGVQLQASINNMQITNNILENNGGVVTGGIGVGQPFVHGSHNFNVRMANNSVIGNGGLTTSGGIGIFYGSNNYELANSVICSNFSVEYGAGISHIGLSPNGWIHNNQIFYNESVDSGAGIALEGELVVGGGALSTGSGSVTVDKNLIQSNYSGDDGGGIFVLDALKERINITNNMLVDNGAADLGGAIMLDDASNVAFVNNTVANNVTTGSAETSDGNPHGAGLSSEGNDPLFQALLGPARTDTAGTRTTAGSATVLDPAITAADVGKNVSGARIQPGAMILSVTPGVSFVMSRPATSSPGGVQNNVALTISFADFSNPVALFNNIFWNNNAYTLSQPGPGATLVNGGFIDFEIHGTTNNTDTFTPRFSDLTNSQILGPNGVQHPVPVGQGNTSGDPLFITPFILELTVTGSRLDPQAAAVTITGADPPVGLTGDYHLTRPANTAQRLVSPVIDRGVRCSNSPVIVPNPLSACANGGIQAPIGSVVAQPAVNPVPGYSADFDGDSRPQIPLLPLVYLVLRGPTPWDLGADEVPNNSTPQSGPLSTQELSMPFTTYLPLINQ